MATIRRELEIDAPAAHVWAALRDFHAVHVRLVPGFVVDSSPDGDDTRRVTFFNGVVARERLVGVDDDARRLAYTVTEGPLASTHHHASAEVIDGTDGRSRFVWITDVLPDALADPIAALMDRGIAVLRETLEASGSR